MADHPDPPGENCVLCHRLHGEQVSATHKIAEDGPVSLHPMTNYVCCRHFQMLGCNCSTYPYEVALHNPYERIFHAAGRGVIRESDRFGDLVQGFDGLVNTGDWLIVWWDKPFEGWAASLHDVSGCPCHAPEDIRCVCDRGCCDPHNLTRTQAEALIRLGIEAAEGTE